MRFTRADRLCPCVYSRDGPYAENSATSKTSRTRTSESPCKYTTLSAPKTTTVLWVPDHVMAGRFRCVLGAESGAWVTLDAVRRCIHREDGNHHSQSGSWVPLGLFELRKVWTSNQKLAIQVEVLQQRKRQRHIIRHGQGSLAVR